MGQPDGERACNESIIIQTFLNVHHTFKEGASWLQTLEVVQGIDTEKLFVGSGIRQIVSGDIGHGRDSLVDVVLLGVVDDALGHGFLIAEVAFLVVVGGQVAVDHFSVIPNANLKYF